MKTVEEIKEILKTRISERRLYHSECVMEKCIELAKIHGADENKAALVGIAHDVAREMKNEEWLDYCEKHGIEIDEEEKELPVLLHAKVGADIAKREFGFTDEMAEAISNHTIGKVGMERLDEILFLADSISDDRSYGGLEESRELSTQNIDLAMISVLDSTIELRIRKKDPIHIESVKLRNSYVRKVLNNKENK